MKDLTEQQEQEMIERAKAGDPVANYQMSLWALEQAIAEPDEERWNRLAAKCLVKAAEAGYGPAQEKMNELLAQTAGAAEAAPAPEPVPAERPAPAARPSAEPAPAGAAKPAGVGAAIAAGAGKLGAGVKALFARSGSGEGAAKSEGGAAGRRVPGFLNFSQWDSAQWKKMQVVCIVICAVLALLLVIMLVSGRSRKNKEAEEVLPTPVAETVVTPEPVTTPEPVLYPDAATREEIAAANLEVFPADEDYVTEAKTVTVSTSGSSLNMRRGPGQSYGQVSSLDNRTEVSVYAYKNGWALVKHNGIWGWCSNDYLTQ